MENLLIFKKNDYFPRKSCVFQIFVVPLQRILTFESTIWFLLVTFESKKQHNY